MISCPACGKQNQDHYRFCLGCGAELPRGGPAEAATAEPEAEDEIVEEETSLGQPAVAAVLPPGKCPECGYVNPPTNRFCASCGFRLDEAEAKPAAAPAEPVATDDDDVSAVLVALDPEGNEVGRFSVGPGETTIGRNTGGIFANDTFLSPEHAVIVADGKGVRIRDLDSLNGVFRKLLAEQRSHLADRQRFRIGQELLQYDALEKSADVDGVTPQGAESRGVVGRLSLVVGRDTFQPSQAIPEHGLSLGRERGDVLFPEDGYVSGLHCHISFEDGEAWVTDLGSSNGTFIQLVEETALGNGDVLLMGQQLFRVTI